MMAKSIVKLTFKQVIDSSACPGFEENVFNDTYVELQMQAPVYNRERKFTTVAEMISANPKANSLHYKVGFAIGLYVEALNKKIPTLTDTLDNSISFDICKTEIVHSDVTDRNKHVIALTYVTAPFQLVDSFGEYLVLSKFNESAVGSELETFTIALQQNLAIVSYKVDQEV